MPQKEQDQVDNRAITQLQQFGSEKGEDSQPAITTASQPETVCIRRHAAGGRYDYFYSVAKQRGTHSTITVAPVPLSGGSAKAEPRVMRWKTQ